MKTLKLLKFRWDGATSTVHQTGETLSQSTGVNVTLREQGGNICAEVFSDDQSEYADLGLEFDGDTVEGFDGAFELPLHVAALLLFNGFKLGEFLVEESDMSEVNALLAQLTEGGK